MKKSDWGIEIVRVSNGYECRYNNDQGVPEVMVITDSESDDLKSGEELLWHVMEFFGFGGSKHDPERLRIVRESNEEKKGKRI